MDSIYLDYTATTPVDKLVLDAMMPYFDMYYGNASSMHSMGVLAGDAIRTSRETIAKLIHCDTHELYFTSGGTESNNWALKGIALANKSKGNHIIVSSIEHDCVLKTCVWLEKQGFYVTYLPVETSGIVDYNEVEKYINKKTILLSVMHVNNELGTIQPVEKLGELCQKHNILFHTDACQSFGKIEIDVQKMGIDLLTINAHKIYGPKGIGALYIRKGVSIEPLLHGGGQEFGLRSTTENIPAIVGFAKAAEQCYKTMVLEQKRIQELHNYALHELMQKVSGFYINGDIHQRIPQIINFSIEGMEGEMIRLLFLLDESGISISAGSACSSNDATNSPSHVLLAIGKNSFEARGAIRVSIGRYTTKNQIDVFLNSLFKTINKLNPIFS